LYKCEGTGTITCTQIKEEGYYLDTVSTTKVLYKCENSVCSAVSQKTGYYIPSADDTTNRLYSYSGSDYAVTATGSEKAGYYIDGESASSDTPTTYSKLIKCSGSSVCERINPNKSSYYVSGEGFTTSYAKLISCDAEKKCSAPAAANEKGFYSNDEGKSEDTVTKLIDCSSATNSCTVVDQPKNGYYLYGDGLVANGKPGSLFLCDNGSCDKDTPSEEGYYLDASGIDTNSKYSKLIKCTLTTGATPVCEFEEVASGNMPSAAGDYFFKNGKDSTKLIKCTYSSANACEEFDPSSITVGYYLDAETKTTDANSNTVYSGLFEFTGSAINAVSTPDGTYVDAVSGSSTGDEITYSKLITCNSSNECTSTAATVGYYINGAIDIATASDKLENALIECTGTTVKCRIIKPSANSLYVDNSTNGNLIQCSTTGGCIVLTSSAKPFFFGGTNKPDKY